MACDSAACQPAAVHSLKPVAQFLRPNREGKTAPFLSSMHSCLVCARCTDHTGLLCCFARPQKSKTAARKRLISDLETEKEKTKVCAMARLCGSDAFLSAHAG